MTRLALLSLLALAACHEPSGYVMDFDSGGANPITVEPDPVKLRYFPVGDADRPPVVRPPRDPSKPCGPLCRIGTPGDDVLIGTPGNDLISGGAGNDLICGGPCDPSIVKRYRNKEGW